MVYVCVSRASSLKRRCRPYKGTLRNLTHRGGPFVKNRNRNRILGVRFIDFTPPPKLTDVDNRADNKGFSPRMATSTPRPVGPQNLEIVPADLDVPEAPLDFKLAKDRHTLDLCVRLTAHEDVFNADNKIKPQQEWGELAPGHNKHHRNAMGLPLNVDYYPFCPCYKKKEYDDEGNIHRVLGLRDYGCSVAVDLYLRLQIEGFFLFICIFLVSLPALSNNLDRNNRRIECREAVEANPFNTSAWLEGCGYAGKPIRNENISWPTAGYPWLRTCLGACEEYSNATDVIQPAVGQHDE